MGLKGRELETSPPTSSRSGRPCADNGSRRRTSWPSLKRALSERVAQVQARERELADALARVEKREQKLDASEERGSRLDSVRLRLAEAKEGARAPSTSAAPSSTRGSAARRARGGARDRHGPSRRCDTALSRAAVSDELDARTASLDAREAELAESASAIAERESALEARAAELEARAAELDAREQAVREAELEPQVVPEEVPQPAPAADELERIEAKLAELREAEQAFVRTQHELAARSESLTEQEAALAERERALAARETPAPSPDLELLEARIRRLEQGGRSRPDEEAQTFSAGLRALQQRGLRGNHEPDEPLH